MRASPIVAGILAFLTVTMILFFVQPLTPQHKETGGSVEVSGAFSLGGQAGIRGLLTINVRNNGTVPVTYVGFLCLQQQFARANCGDLQVLFNGAPVSHDNPIPVGGTATGMTTVLASFGTAFHPGSQYVVTTQAAYSDGTTQSMAITLIANPFKSP